MLGGAAAGETVKKIGGVRVIAEEGDDLIEYFFPTRV